MHRRSWIIPALVVLACGCAAVDPGVTATRSTRDSRGVFGGDPADPDESNGSSVPRDYPLIEGIVDFGERGPVHPEYDGYLTAAFSDIQTYWASAYPEVYGEEFVPLQGGIYAGYPGRQAPIPACTREGGNASYEDIQAGTAYYCPLGDYIAYDDDDSLPSLVESLGREAVAVALAHEFGHAVQARADEFDQPVVLMEQQADCFAGAWVAHVAAGASDVIVFDDRGIRAGLVAMLSIADPIPTDGSSPLSNENAHGTGFDRVGAFQDGFLGGAMRCKSFFTEGRLEQLINLPFQLDDPNAGNLPLRDPGPIDPEFGPIDIITLIPLGLDEFWVALLEANEVAFTPPTWREFAPDGPYPTCSGISAEQWPNGVLYCADDNTIYWDEGYAVLLAGPEGFGDMAVGYLFSNAYSEAVQVALGSNSTGETRALLNGCLTGVWAAWTLPTNAEQTLVLSAGDLDEALITAIIRSDPTTDTDVNGSAFEATDAFRAGVLGGVEECQARV